MTGLEIAALLSGGLQGVGQATQQTPDTERMQRIMMALQLQRQMQMNPLQDRAMFELQARQGLPQQQFKPVDIFQGSTPASIGQMGGIDRNALNQQLAGYQPGAGGMGNQSLLKLLLEQIGYGQLPGGEFVQANDRRYEPQALNGLQGNALLQEQLKKRKGGLIFGARK
jgi:hypothetical protein